MSIKVNLSGVEGGEFEVLPSGRYPCHVFEVNEKTAQSSGNEMIEFVFKVDEDHPTAAGRQFWHNCVLIEKALWNLKRTLVALGYAAEELEGELDIDPDILVGKPCVVEVTQREYNQEMRNNVKRVLPADADIGDENTVKVSDL